MSNDNTGDNIITLFRPQGLAYAENRAQNPAHLFSTGSDDPLAPSKFEWVSGTPSYISIADGVQIMDVLCLLAESFRRWKGNVPFIAIAGKHGNPCGAALSFSSPRMAIHNALMGDTVAVMGGEVITNFPISKTEAHTLFQPIKSIGRTNWGLDLIIAPSFSDEAITLLGKREKRRLLANPALKDTPFPEDQWMYRQVRSDWLRQKSPNFVLTPAEVQSWSGLEMREDEFQNALIAFACCWRASSNTVALAVDNMLIGLGCGQQDRIACVRLALDRANRAGHNVEGSIFASDAFFPYATSKSALDNIDRDMLSNMLVRTRAILESSQKSSLIMDELSALSALISNIDRREGTELLIDAGCKGGVVPADGKELEDVKALFEKHNLAVAFVPPECRGFAKH